MTTTSITRHASRRPPLARPPAARRPPSPARSSSSRRSSRCSPARASTPGHPISQLSTGGLGWIQIATFVLTGLGVLALADRARAPSPRGSAAGGADAHRVFGAGLIAAGLFTMDPELGFPVGAPDGQSPRCRGTRVVHSAAAALAFTALAVAAIVLPVRYIRRRAVARHRQRRHRRGDAAACQPGHMRACRSRSPASSPSPGRPSWRCRLRRSA